MSDFIVSAKFWWPGILRALVIILLASGTMFVSQIEKLTTAATLEWGWVEWCKFFGPIVIASLIALKGFLDDTMSRLREKNETRIFTKP